MGAKQSIQSTAKTAIDESPVIIESVEIFDNSRSIIIEAPDESDEGKHCDT